MMMRLASTALRRVSGCGPSAVRPLRAACVGAVRFQHGAPTNAQRIAGSLFVWGSNKEGQLGEPSVRGDTPTPVPLSATLPFIEQVSCGGSHSLAVTDEGKVYSWGSSEYGALGLQAADGSPVKSISVPSLVDVLEGQHIVSVAAGHYHSVAVSEEGDVYTWGWGGSFFSGWGGLGHGDKTQQNLPGLVESLSEDGHVVTQVSCGAKHTLALTKEGVVLCWGDGEFGRLGNGSSSAPVPEIVEELANVPCKQVACGESYSMAVSTSGELWVWGRNDQSQLGLGANLTMDLNSMEEFPLVCAPLQEFGKVAHVAAGRQHAVAVMDDGSVFHWGARQFIEPQRLTVMDEHTVVHASAGDDCSALLTQTGQLFTFGKRRAGVLGHGVNRSKKQPTLVEYFQDHAVSLHSIELGAKHAVAIAGSPPAAPKASEATSDPVAEES